MTQWDVDKEDQACQWATSCVDGTLESLYCQQKFSLEIMKYSVFAAEHSCIIMGLPLNNHKLQWSGLEAAAYGMA